MPIIPIVQSHYSQRHGWGHIQWRRQTLWIFRRHSLQLQYKSLIHMTCLESLLTQNPIIVSLSSGYHTHDLTGMLNIDTKKSESQIFSQAKIMTGSDSLLGVSNCRKWHKFYCEEPSAEIKPKLTEIADHPRQMAWLFHKGSPDQILWHEVCVLFPGHKLFQ